MVTTARVDYEKLVAAYWANLTTILRGFSPGEELEFLEAWVHDDDAARSILNMLEAAKDYGLRELVVELSPQTVSTINVDQLATDAGQLGQVRLEPRPQGVELHMAFPAPAAASWSIHPRYQKQLRAALQKRTHERPLPPQPGLELAQATYESASLVALVDAKHIVQEAAYSGTTSDVECGLLELLCQFLEGKPIQEGSDHAVIDLEYHLRDHGQPAPVAGVVTPTNADPAFALPTRLVRGLLADYRHRTGYAATENFYEPLASPEWRALTPPQRMEKLHAAIAQIPAGAGMKALRLEVVTRVVVEFADENLDSLVKQDRMMQVETYLRENLEPALRLYMQPQMDQNKLRQMKGVRL